MEQALKNSKVTGFLIIAAFSSALKWLKRIAYAGFCLLIPYTGIYAFDSGEYPEDKEAKVAIEFSSNINSNTDTVRINALIRTINATLGNHISLAEKLSNEALALATELNYSSGMIECYLALANIHLTRGNFDQAEKSIQQGLRIGEQSGDEMAQARFDLAMFRLLFEKGEYSEAPGCNEKAKAIGVKLSNQEILAYVFGNEGIITSIRGDRTAALEYFFKSMEMFKVLKNEPQVGLTLLRIGHTFELAGSYDKALDYLLQSLEINQHLDNLSNTGWSLLNIGVVYSRLNNTPLMMQYYEKALAIAEQAENLRLTLAALDNIGGRYSIEHDFISANKYLRRAYALSKKAGHNSRTVFITGNLAENFLYAGQYDSAERYGLENLGMAIGEKNSFEKRQAYMVLSEIYAAKKEYAKGYTMLLNYANLSDSVFNEEKSRQIEELREKYETEKKEVKITTLTQEKASAEFRRNTFAILSVLFLAVGVLVFYILRLRVKRNRMLLEKGQEVDRMKTRFFTNISHEFRTPLTLILGPVTNMLSNTHDAAAKKQLTSVEQNANRLLELVNQLLDLSKIESGSMKLNVSTSDIMTVLKGVALSFHAIAQQKEIDLVINVSPEKLVIRFDRPKFETILINLLANAFKFTPQKGRITVESGIIKKNTQKSYREFIAISVTDTGRGIPEKDIGNIFNRFYQSDDNQLLQQEGSGIGLALSKELVELHGGNIYPTSQFGEGTKIIFEIPVDIPEGDTVAAGSLKTKRNRSVEITEQEHDWGTELQDEATLLNAKPIVLVVEDHREVQHYIRDILKEKYSVLLANDGHEGIMKATDAIPDLIISDVMMPKKDGYEVSKTLKNDERTSHIPIILLTAKADSEDKIDGLKTRADDYVTKPFIPDELLVRVENLIDSRQRLRKKYKKESTLKPSEIAENSVDEKFLNKLIVTVENQLGNEHFGVEQLSEEIGMSRSQLHRKLKALVDQGPNQFIRSFRLNRAHNLLKQRVATAAEIAYRVGFGSPSYFTKCFQEQFGYTPSEIMEKARE